MARIQDHHLPQSPLLGVEEGILESKCYRVVLQERS